MQLTNTAENQRQTLEICAYCHEGPVHPNTVLSLMHRTLQHFNITLAAHNVHACAVPCGNAIGSFAGTAFFNHNKLVQFQCGHHVCCNVFSTLHRNNAWDRVISTSSLTSPQLLKQAYVTMGGWTTREVMIKNAKLLHIFLYTYKTHKNNQQDNCLVSITHLTGLPTVHVKFCSESEEITNSK